MKLLSIHPEGGKKMRSVHVASVGYENEDGKQKIVPVFSRRPVEKPEDLEGYVAGVAVLVADPINNKILLTNEFRLAVNRKVIGLPTGIPDKGESIFDAAKREVKEETGLSIEPVSASEPLYINPAESNEQIRIVKAYIPSSESHQIKKSDNANEEVNAFWADKNKIKELKDSMSLMAYLIFGTIMK